MEHRVIARNTATASSNKIHDDAVARDLGFRGGLVPGVDVFAYLCHLPAHHWGRDWVERGSIAARFRAPVYDGDEVVVTGEAAGDGSVMSLVLRDPGGADCATAEASVPVQAPERPDPAGWPSGPLPHDPPPATEATLRSRELGAVEATFHADRAGQYLDEVGEDLPLFRSGGVAHPGWLLRFANRVLAGNVRLGPWIHVESSMQLLGAVTDGQPVETRALVTGVSERGGHRFVDLDVIQLAAGHPVSRIQHRAIYQPRGVASA